LAALFPSETSSGAMKTSSNGTLTPFLPNKRLT
jgi:hypothetical protein